MRDDWKWKIYPDVKYGSPTLPKIDQIWVDAEGIKWQYTQNGWIKCSASGEGDL